MLNRRHLRIKGFQALYAYQQAEVKEQKLAEKQLLQAVQLVHDAYINLLQLALALAQFEENAVAEKGNKHMPTAADLNATAVLLKNKFIAQLAQDVDFQKIAKAYKINWNGEEVLLREILTQLKSEHAYLEYANLASPSHKEDQDFMQYLYKKVLFKFPLLEQHLEEKYLNWPVDAETVESMILKTIKAFKLNTALDLLPITANWDEDRIFILDLFNKTIQNEIAFNELIANKTQNWDVERIAMVDTILMKMAITEFVHFQSIPTKVTMNEYIDISKEFSTPKSKGFINGILDKILIDLKENNQINKSGRGLVN
jgi:N utilization substance protein B